MTQVIFYVYVADRMRFLYGLLSKKLLPRELRVYIAASDDAEAAALDRYLWTVDVDGFLPHARVEDANAKHSPVVIGVGEPASDFQAQVLVSWQTETPPFLGRFDYLIDISETQHNTAAQKRYKYCKEHGYPLDLHKIGTPDKKESDTHQ